MTPPVHPPVHAPAALPWGVRLGLAAQLRRFALVGLALAVLFILELLILSTFLEAQTDLLAHWNRTRSSGPQLTVLGMIAVVVALIVVAARWKRRHPGIPSSNLWFCLVVAAILVLGLCGVAWLPSIEVASNLEMADAVFLVVLVVGAPAAAIFAVRWINRRSRWGLLGGWLALLPVFAYLATDDPTLARNTTLEEIAPAFPGAETSFEVLMRYGKRHPLGKSPLATRGPQRIWKNFGLDMSTDPDPKAPAKFRRFLTAQRAAIEADWAELAPVRAWWAELAAFARLGDLTPSSPAAEILAFQPIRSYGQLAVAIAGLQALDGQGDAAFATLQPLIEVARKLEPSSRNLSRSMMARISQGQALTAAQFVLDTTAVSPAARARFAAALSVGVSGEAGARRLIAIESALVMAMLEQPESTYFDFLPYSPKSGEIFLVQAVKAFGSVLYNPRRTSNIYGELVAELQDMAARRDFANMDARSLFFLAGKGRPHFKNFLGGIALKNSTTQYARIIESYWAREDQRTALLARLSQP